MWVENDEANTLIVQKSKSHHEFGSGLYERAFKFEGGRSERLAECEWREAEPFIERLSIELVEFVLSCEEDGECV